MAEGSEPVTGEAQAPLVATWIAASGVWYGYAFTTGQEYTIPGDLPETLREKVLTNRDLFAVKGRYGDGVKANRAEAVEAFAEDLEEAVEAQTAAQEAANAAAVAEAAALQAEAEVIQAERDAEAAKDEAEEAERAAKLAEREAAKAGRAAGRSGQRVRRMTRG